MKLKTLLCAMRQPEFVLGNGHASEGKGEPDPETVIPLEGGPVLLQGEAILLEGGPILQEGGPVLLEGEVIPLEGGPILQEGGPVLLQGEAIPLEGGPILQEGGPILLEGEAIPIEGKPSSPARFAKNGFTRASPFWAARSRKEGVMPDSYAEKTQRWATLCANAEPLLGLVPVAAQELHSGIKAAANELGGMADRIQDLQGQAHALAKRRQDLVRRVSEDATRFKVHLQAFLGPKNPELLQLGIRPQDFRGRLPRRRPKRKLRPTPRGVKGCP